MATTRQNKVSRLLQKELGEIFQREGRDILSGKMISVTNVRVTSDLSQARIFLSVFPALEKADFTTALEQKSGHLRYELGNRIKHQLRIVPELSFFLDDSLDYLDNIDKLLKE